jgi:sec-independent protein translocase protein TatA
MPFSLGPLEMVFVMIVLLLLFGAKKLPELGSGLGKGIREFKRSMSDVTGELQKPAAPSLPAQPAPGQVAAGVSSSAAPAPVEPVVQPADPTQAS